MSEFMDFVEIEMSKKTHVSYGCMMWLPNSIADPQLICSFEREEDAIRYCREAREAKGSHYPGIIFGYQEIVNLSQDGSK